MTGITKPQTKAPAEYSAELPSVVLKQLAETGYRMGECIEPDNFGRDRIVKALDAAIEVLGDFPGLEETFEFQTKSIASMGATNKMNVKCTINDISENLVSLKKRIVENKGMIELNGDSFSKFALAALIMNLRENGWAKKIPLENILRAAVSEQKIVQI
ncbi:MAG: hypothetical protein LBG89_02500 [Rickettsiales bacterium]|jgi:hypothetical protein|nr:hypothetical protein [Rickettsiales bacterium]